MIQWPFSSHSTLLRCDRTLRSQSAGRHVDAVARDTAGRILRRTDINSGVVCLALTKVEVIGLTTLFGNVKTPMATANALHLLEMVGRIDVPVAEVRAASSSAKIATALPWLCFVRSWRPPACAGLAHSSSLGGILPRRRLRARNRWRDTRRNVPPTPSDPPVPESATRSRSRNRSQRVPPPHSGFTYLLPRRAWEHRAVKSQDEPLRALRRSAHR